jgi:hypothetical protein
MAAVFNSGFPHFNILRPETASKKETKESAQRKKRKNNQQPSLTTCLKNGVHSSVDGLSLREQQKPQPHAQRRS